MGQHDLSIARAYVQRPGIADRFRALYVEPMLVQIQALRQKEEEARALLVAQKKTSEDEPPLSVEASGTSSTVSLRASRPDNSTLGSPAEVYLEAKDFVPRFRGFDGDRKCLVHAADRLDKNGQLRENMLMHIVPVEVERGLTLKERELLRMKEGEVNGDQPEPQAAAATQSASQIALIALMNAPAMDRKGVTSAKLAEFVVSYEKYMESVARRNMPGVLEVLAHEAAIRIDNEQILSKG